MLFYSIRNSSAKSVESDKAWYKLGWAVQIDLIYVEYVYVPARGLILACTFSYIHTLCIRAVKALASLNSLILRCWLLLGWVVQNDLIYVEYVYVPARGLILACTFSYIHTLCIRAVKALASLTSLILRCWLLQRVLVPKSCLLHSYKWASSWQNLSSGFLTKWESNKPAQLQRLARKMKFRL